VDVRSASMKTFTAIVALAGVVATMAACPNMCSGHGRCNEFDKCECYRYDGTSKDRRVMWTGADCSQRTCPYDIAFADIATKNRDVSTNAVHLNPQTAFDGTPHTTSTWTNYLKVDASDYKLTESKTFNVRVYSVDAGNSKVKFQWKLDEQDAYSRIFEVESSNSRPLSYAIELGRNYATTGPGDLTNGGIGETGVRVYMDAASINAANIAANNLYTFTVDFVDGVPYLKDNADSSHQETECSGKGLCDRNSGRCQCFAGYEGEACQRTSCPNDCSGHGVCQSERRFVEDTGLTYATRSNNGAYDADKEMGCLCDVGYRGADCSLVECPSGADPLGGAGAIGVDGEWQTTNALDCSGRGLCDYSCGLCNCFKGYSGERCETQTVFV